MLTRRSVLASLLVFPTAGCQSGETQQVRYRVILNAHIDGLPVEASTVMEVHYSRVRNSLSGAGGASRLYGEALIFDMGPRGAIYVLPCEHTKLGSLRQIYEAAILTTLGIKDSIGTLSDDDFVKLRTATGRMPFQFYTRLPAFVAFTDERNPKSIYEVSPGRLGEHFPGITFDRLEVEFTDAPVTQKLRDRLPWLNTPAQQQVFERKPASDPRGDAELPMSYLVVKEHFFGSGSRESGGGLSRIFHL